MAAFRAAGTFSQNAGNGDVSPILPTNFQDDILLWLCSQADTVHGSMTGGYKEAFFFTNGANHAVFGAWKRSSGSEGSPTYTHPGGNGAGGFLLAFSGCHGVYPLMPVYVAPNKESGTGATQTATAKGIDPAYTTSGVLFVCSEAGSGTGGTSGNNFASWSGTNPTFTECCDNQAFNGSLEATIGAAFGTSDGTATGDRTVALSGLDAGAHTIISFMVEIVDSAVVVSLPFNQPGYSAFPKVAPV